MAGSIKIPVELENLKEVQEILENCCTLAKKLNKELENLAGKKEQK